MVQVCHYCIEKTKILQMVRYVIYCIEKTTILQMVQVCHLLYREDYNTPDGTGMSFTV